MSPARAGFFTRIVKPTSWLLKNAGENRISIQFPGRCRSNGQGCRSKKLAVNQGIGSAEFNRQIWLQANLHGIEAQGYKPKERDIAELEQLKQQRIAGSIEKSHERKGEKEKPKTETEIDKSTLTGTLVAHGHAPFEHDPKGTSSYFVDIETTNGRKTVWGVDLHRAIDESKAKPGDKISIEHKGKEPLRSCSRNTTHKARKSAKKRFKRIVTHGTFAKVTGP